MRTLEAFARLSTPGLVDLWCDREWYSPAVLTLDVNPVVAEGMPTVSPCHGCTASVIVAVERHRVRSEDDVVWVESARVRQVGLLAGCLRDLGRTCAGPPG